LFAILLSNCSSIKPDENTTYPKSPDDQREEKYGKLSGEGIKLFGGKEKNNNDSNIQSIGVNKFLWRSALDIISFIPLKSADSIGGTILTEWYETAENERFKFNIFILDSELNSRSIKVSAFKQIKNEDLQWVNSKASADVALEIEEKILLKAREYKLDRINP
ncbi:MAG: DUF3576 domain-containing protein, partial [Pseudomonadota bacterium]